MSVLKIMMVVAITCVTFDGRRREPGDSFELPLEEAERLIESGAVRLHDGAKPAPEVPNKGLEVVTGDGGDAPRVTLPEAIADLVARVDDGTVTAEAAYTSSGKPDATFLAQMVGRTVSAKERDAAWADFQESRDGTEGGGEE